MEILSPIFARITKVDETTRSVTGRATQEMVDRDKEVFDYATSKPNFQAWSASVYADTGGKSLGNVRAMHGSVAAGILRDIDFNDAEKAIDVTAHITDDAEWKKVVTGTYSGFSIGGKYTKKWSDVLNGQVIHRYTADPAEISIVDRPCVPAAKFFTVHKADGSDVEVPFAPSLMRPTEGSATDGAVAGLGFYARIKLDKRDFSDAKREELADSGAALPDGSFPIVNRKDLENAVQAHGRASDPDKAKAHIKARAKVIGAEDALPDDWKKTETVDLSKAMSANDVNAMEATGAALGASNQAFTTNDVDEHENAAAAHAKAATEQLALGNSNLASHHINAAKAHLDWQASKPAKVPPQPAQGKQRVH